MNLLDRLKAQARRLGEEVAECAFFVLRYYGVFTPEAVVPAPRIYLSGPMSLQKDDPHDPWNFKTFNEAARRLRALGYRVVNPVDLDGGMLPGPDFDEHQWRRAIRRDIRALTRCKGVAVLPHWYRSRGARLEVLVAWVLGMPIFDAYALAAGRDVTLSDASLRRILGDPLRFDTDQLHGEVI